MRRPARYEMKNEGQRSDLEASGGGARSPHALIATCAALCALLAGPALQAQQQRRAEATYEIDQPALIGAEGRTGDWLTYGRTYKEQRFSPLDQINADNVHQLGLAWSYETATRRGMEGTPLVVDGVLYATGAWNNMYALDVVTGEPLWTYDPEVPRSISSKICCDAVNRGAALYRGKIISGTLDGRLIAIDAESGELAWSTVTIPSDSEYTITGAPRIVKGMVIIGNGGAEYGVRGYVTAYDAETGEQVWRFYTVPGNPADGFENEAMEMAAETWTGEWWKGGGGGTVWDSIVYDPELDLLYLGVGNGAPWDRNLRSPGGGDNLFLSSIVAVRPDTGEYVWHYQTTPGDTLGLHGHAADDARRAADRRQGAQGDHAGAQERLLLRHRSCHRRADLGGRVRHRDLGQSRRHGYRQAGRNPRCALHRRHGGDLPGPPRWPQLAPDVV